VSYAMSKAAELALMRHIARRYGPKGIRANAIAPGLIWHYKFDEQPMPEGIVDQTRARQFDHGPDDQRRRRSDLSSLTAGRSSNE
jgi:NAD(P)-dependent dehydrogenase (short-subunit alcohol dehydrogenase family)